MAQQPDAKRRPGQLAEACEIAAKRILDPKPLKLRESEQIELAMRLRQAAEAIRTVFNCPPYESTGL